MNYTHCRLGKKDDDNYNGKIGVSKPFGNDFINEVIEEKKQAAIKKLEEEVLEAAKAKRAAMTPQEKLAEKLRIDAEKKAKVAEMKKALSEKKLAEEKSGDPVVKQETVEEGEEE